MNKIIPYVGCGEYDLSMTLEEVRQKLKSSGIKFRQEHWDNKRCTPEVPWDIIRIDNTMSMFFAKDKMFKMYFETPSTWILENGITTNMSIKEASLIDDSIVYNEDEEDFESSNGYWLEESLDTGKIESITIFIKELLDDDIFYSYEWIKDNR